MYKYFNANPEMKHVGDCVIRAISKALNQDWKTTYWDICMEGLHIHDMPSSDNVWGSYLYKKGFRRNVIPNDCPLCYTIRDFAYDHPHGTYILATNDRSHIVCVKDGDVFDTYDSSDEVPIYFWRKEL